MTKRLIILLSIYFLLISCSEDEKFNVRAYENPSNFDQVFDTFWVKMSTSYLYWDVDTTNWDNIYSKFKPLFHQLDISNSADRQRSIDYFRKITAGLIDCHYYMEFNSKYFPYNQTINPSLTRKQALALYRAPYNFQELIVNYLDPVYRIGNEAISKTDNQNLSTVSGTINKNILYFSCSSMHLQTAYQTLNNKNKKVLDFFFDNLKNPSIPLKGVIIDLRYNNGGELADLNFLVGKFINAQYHFGYTHYKSSTNRLDFTPWVKSFINPIDNQGASNLPIVVLADNFTASTSELIAYAIQSLPNGTLIGETTYGATGPLTLYEIYNAGSFNVGDFLTIQTSSAVFRTLGNQTRENIGFDPDINVQFDANSISNGIDLQLEKAIVQLKK